MAFAYEPQEVQENKFTPWPAGEYDFEVVSAEEQTSKAGNPMIKLRLKIFNAEGNERTQFDYLISTANAAYKLKHFCESVGLDYAAAAWDCDDCVGRSGRLKLNIQKGNDAYPDDRNGVADYISGETAPVSTKSLKDELNDEIPF